MTMTLQKINIGNLSLSKYNNKVDSLIILTYPIEYLYKYNTLWKYVPYQNTSLGKRNMPHRVPEGLKKFTNLWVKRWDHVENQTFYLGQM